MTKMDTIERFELSGDLGKKGDGTLVLSSRMSKRQKAPAMEYFLHSLVPSRPMKPVRKLKLHPKKMVFYKGIDNLSIYPRGENGKTKYSISSVTNEDDLNKFHDQLRAIKGDDTIEDLPLKLVSPLITRRKLSIDKKRIKQRKEEKIRASTLNHTRSLESLSKELVALFEETRNDN